MNSSVQGHVDSGTLGFYPKVSVWLKEKQKNKGLKPMNAGEIRKLIRNKRRALTPAQQQSAAKNLASLISQQPFFQRAKRIGIYLANDGEIDPSLLLGIALAANKACFLPILHPEIQPSVVWRVSRGRPAK